MEGIKLWKCHWISSLANPTFRQSIRLGGKFSRRLKLHVTVYTAVARQRIYSKWKVRASASKSTDEASNTILICLDERTGSITQLEVVDPSMTHPEALRIHVAIPQGLDKTSERHGSRFQAFPASWRPWYQPPPSSEQRGLVRLDFKIARARRNLCRTIVKYCSIDHYFGEQFW